MCRDVIETREHIREGPAVAGTGPAEERESRTEPAAAAGRRDVNALCGSTALQPRRRLSGVVRHPLCQEYH